MFCFFRFFAFFHIFCWRGDVWRRLRVFCLRDFGCLVFCVLGCCCRDGEFCLDFVCRSAIFCFGVRCLDGVFVVFCLAVFGFGGSGLAEAFGSDSGLVFGLARYFC